MKNEKIGECSIENPLWRAKARKLMKEWAASAPRTKPTREEVEAARQRIRASLIRAGHSKKDAIRMTNRKNFF